MEHYLKRYLMNMYDKQENEIKIVEWKKKDFASQVIYFDSSTKKNYSVDFDVWDILEFFDIEKRRDDRKKMEELLQKNQERLIQLLSY